MHELYWDITPVGRILDHHVSKDVKAYPLQIAVKSFISVPEVYSQGISSS